MTIDIQGMFRAMQERAEYGSKFIQYLRADGCDGDPELKFYASHPKTELPAIEVKLGSSGRGALRPKRYQGFEVAVERLQWEVGRPTDMAIIYCKIDSLEDVFQRFIQTIVDSLSGGQTPHAAVATAVEKWVAFFSKSGTKKNPQELMGLFGELLFLGERLTVAKDPLLVLDCWKGPEGRPWDFIFPDGTGSCFVEVKTTGLDRRRIIVNGLDQLWAADTTRNSYWIYWLRANWFRHEDGSSKGSIFELIGKLQTFCSGVSEEVRLTLDDLLRAIGLLDIDSETLQAYQAIKITAGKSCWLSVREDFPALHRGNVVNATVLDRVSEVQYSLTLKDEDIVKEGPKFKGI